MIETCEDLESGTRKALEAGTCEILKAGTFEVREYVELQIWKLQ
jgi:hypothetical protein